MGAAALPVIMFTLIWGGVGIVAPYFVKAGPNKRLIQTCLALTAACCWLFWLVCYMSQMNPLIGGSHLSSPYTFHDDKPFSFPGPELELSARVAMRDQWGFLHGKDDS